MSDFVVVAQTSEITDPGSLLVEVEDRLLVLIHAAGHFPIRFLSGVFKRRIKAGNSAVGDLLSRKTSNSVSRSVLRGLCADILLRCSA